MNQTVPKVVCPGCKVEMRPVEIVPAKYGPDHLGQITYRCPECGTETARQMKLD